MQAELQLREVSAGELPVVEGRQRRGWEVPQDPVLLGAVQGIHKSLQYHSSKVSILHRSIFFMVQLSHPLISYFRKWSFSEKRICKYIRTHSLHLLLSNITNTFEKEVCFFQKEKMPTLKNYHKIMAKLFSLFLSMAKLCLVSDLLCLWPDQCCLRPS